MTRDAALDFLIRLADGVAAMFGANCEVVIHDMTNFKHSIVYIVNGQVTARQCGDRFTIVGVDDLNRFFAGTDLINCKAVTKDRRSLKSSTFHLDGDGYHFALGINYDFTPLNFAQKALADLTSTGQDIGQAIEGNTTAKEQLDSLFDEALRLSSRTMSLLDKEGRLELVRALEARGAFAIQRSIPLVAERLNVSRYTLYNYLREIRGNN